MLKGLRKYAEPTSSFSMIQRRHIRVSWDMTNDEGERVVVKDTLSVSPNDRNWVSAHKRQLERKFRELGISKEINHI